jgi:Methyltransferase domain
VVRLAALWYDRHGYLQTVQRVGYPQMRLSRTVTRLKLLRIAWRERGNIRSMFGSGNYRFLQFYPPGHFYSPIPDVKEIRASSHIIFDRSPTQIPGIDVSTEAQVELAREFVEYYEDIPFPDSKQDGCRYYLDNGYFSYGDAVVLYSMMRRFKPSRIIEVGSGFSSAAMLDVNDRFYNSEIDFTFIEPFPDRLLGLLEDRDKERCCILQEPVQEVPVVLFSNLHENDILFVDSSHVAKAHSDVVHLCFNVLPLLDRGVIVHFHDILWPFEYPSLWFDNGRAWNEAYLLRAFLQYNNTFRVLYFNSLMEIKHDDFLRNELPLAMKQPSSPLTPGNTSLWIRKMQ